eukprot:1186277-Prorocentrum_minimum.AAC.2
MSPDARALLRECAAVWEDRLDVEGRLSTGRDALSPPLLAAAAVCRVNLARRGSKTVCYARWKMGENETPVVQSTADSGFCHFHTRLFGHWSIIATTAAEVLLPPTS